MLFEVSRGPIPVSLGVSHTPTGRHGIFLCGEPGGFDITHVSFIHVDEPMGPWWRTCARQKEKILEHLASPGGITADIQAPSSRTSVPMKWCLSCWTEQTLDHDPLASSREVPCTLEVCERRSVPILTTWRRHIQQHCTRETQLCQHSFTQPSSGSSGRGHASKRV